MKKINLILILIGCITTTVFSQAIPDSLKTTYGQFDFWIGEWDVYPTGNDTLVVGQSKIESILNGRVIKESYKSGANFAFQGTSLSTYNQTNKKWEQYWTDNQGTAFLLQGKLKDGKMILGRELKTATGKLKDRITWSMYPDKSVRQVWEQSTDDGETWNSVFDGHYKPKTK